MGLSLPFLLLLPPRLSSLLPPNIWEVPVFTTGLTVMVLELLAMLLLMLMPLLAPLLLPLLLLPPPQLSELSMPLPIPQLSLPPQLLMLLPQLLMLLMPLPQLLMLLPLLLMPLLLLLPLLLALSALSSRLRMSSATLLTDTRTSTLPSKNREMPMEVSPDLTLMLMRLESTLSTMLLMIWDSEFPEITSQLPPSTTLPSQL